MKKSWNRPELTVLVRTRPEEAILGTCKSTLTDGGRMNANGQCLVNPADPGFGSPCDGVCETTPSS